MKRPLTLTASLATGAALLLVAGAAHQPSTAAPPVSGQLYEVTITNLTAAQIFAPALAVVHSPAASVFRAGQAASPELALLAEDGDNSALGALLLGDADVSDVASGTGMIPPGQSETLLVKAKGNERYLSLAAMLVSTNDTFVGLDTIELPKGDAAVLLAPAYDAGSEANSENCRFIPGPPCGSGGVHDPAPAEGFVHVSGGIRGTVDVPVAYDWRNPVARIHVRRKQ